MHDLKADWEKWSRAERVSATCLVFGLATALSTLLAISIV